jgi:hypothetical protein
LHFQVIPNNRENPPSPNERLSKGYRIGDIKASAHASHKTHACISLKQRGYSRNYGLVCNLGKQMAVLSDMRDKVLVGLNFIENKLKNYNQNDDVFPGQFRNAKTHAFCSLSMGIFSDVEKLTFMSVDIIYQAEPM